MITHKASVLFPVLLFLLLLLIGLPVQAANHYVRQGATGANNGSDWINAFTDLPITLIRGDVYYVADGNYCPNGYIFDDAVDGEKYISVLKATVSAHGTDIGWNNSYGDGQAIFTETIDIRASYIVFDGVVGGAPVNGTLFPDPSAYGFSVIPKNTHGVEHKLILAPRSADIDYIQISHFSIINLGFEWDNGEYGQTCIYIGLDYATDHYIISNNYLANASTNLTFYNSSHTIVENNYFISNWSSPQSHGQMVAPGWNSDDVIIRNNVFYHPAVFVFGAHESGLTINPDCENCNGSSDRWQVYNNIVIGDGATQTVTAGFANAESAKYNSILNSDFHHNIFYNLSFARGAVFIGRVSDDLLEGGKNRVYNNIFYKVRHVDLSGIGYTPGTIIHQYNDYYNCSGNMYPDPTDVVYDGVDPFVNSAQFDFRLKGPTQPGKVLLAPFDIDRTGIARGLDNNWDRGCFEYLPALTITSPNGFEIWPRGHQRTITWNANGVTGNLVIELLQNGGVVGVIAPTVLATQGTFAWTVGRLQNGTFVTGPNLKIRISTMAGAVLAEKEIQ